MSTSRFGIAQKVQTPVTVRMRVMPKRREAVARQFRDPYQSPPVALPSA